MGIFRFACCFVGASALTFCGTTRGHDFAGASSGDGAGDGGGSRRCRLARDCDANETCLRLPGSCHEDTDATPGTCVPSDARADAGCTLSYPVCACDGQVYADGCVLKASGQAVSYGGAACSLPAGTFECNYEVCSSANDYCFADTDRACMPLPDACKAPDAGCECFGISGGRCGCVKTDAGYFDVECAE